MTIISGIEFPNDTIDSELGNGKKGKVCYDQEPPSVESTTTECGVNYLLLAVSSN